MLRPYPTSVDNAKCHNIAFICYNVPNLPWNILLDYILFGQLYNAYKYNENIIKVFIYLCHYMRK